MLTRESTVTRLVLVIAAKSTSSVAARRAADLRPRGLLLQLEAGPMQAINVVSWFRVKVRDRGGEVTARCRF